MSKVGTGTVKNSYGSATLPTLPICFKIFVWLLQEFGKFGTLESIKIVLDTKSGQSRGFGFITFQNLKDATKAKNALTETGQKNTQKHLKEHLHW